MKTFLGAFALICVFAAGCLAEGKKPLVVATTGMIADGAKALLGEHAEVRSLIGEGVDPHLYKPTRTDIVLLREADLVFSNGLHLEGKMTDALERLKSAGRSVISLGDELEPKRKISAAEFAGNFDPHMWMDPELWSEVSQVMSKALQKKFPERKEQILEAGERYKARLLKLDRYSQKILSSVPEKSRVLVTAHDAFEYLGRRYKYEVVGIQGLSTESEAGVLDIERIVELLVSRKIKAVFVESTVSERNMHALIEGAAARGHEVKIGGNLFSDAMGAANTREGTYEGMIEHNINTIATALGGDVPEGGFQSWKDE